MSCENGVCDPGGGYGTEDSSGSERWNYEESWNSLEENGRENWLDPWWWPMERIGNRRKITARETAREAVLDAEPLTMARDITKKKRRFGVLQMINKIYASKYGESRIAGEDDVRYQAFVTKTRDLLDNDPVQFLVDFTARNVKTSTYEAVWIDMFEVPIPAKATSNLLKSNFVRSYYQDRVKPLELNGREKDKEYIKFLMAQRTRFWALDVAEGRKPGYGPNGVKDQYPELKGMVPMDASDEEAEY